MRWVVVVGCARVMVDGAVGIVGAQAVIASKAITRNAER